MREILFRGRRIDTDKHEWISGLPFRNDYTNQWYLRNGLPWNDAEIIPESLCEFTDSMKTYIAYGTIKRLGSIHDKEVSE